MAQVRLTKNELRKQELKRNQLRKYLPTLQLKKAMLQMEVNQSLSEIEEIKNAFAAKRKEIEAFQYLLSDSPLKELFNALNIVEVVTASENIAGVEIPVFEKVEFSPQEYSLSDTPLWWDETIEALKQLLEIKQRLNIANQKKDLLEIELRSVSIRVNLFEKILIPRAIVNIKKIKIFLDDQQLSAVSQAKVAKGKIEKVRLLRRKRERL